jgi:hypothetical protein
MAPDYGNGHGNNGNGSDSIDFVFPITKELKDQGIEGFRIKDQNAILVLASDPNNKKDSNDHMVLFPFYRNNYDRSIQKLKDRLELRNVDDRLITIYCLKITELLLQYILDYKTGKVKKRPKEEQETLKEMQLIVDEINSLRTKYAGISVEVWEMERVKRFNALRNTIKEKMPNAWESLELVLTVKGVRHIADITLPVVLIIIGDPGTWKTVGIGLIRRWPDVVYKDKISAKSWVSHASKEDVEELEGIDLIKQIRNRTFAIPELAPIFMQKDEILSDTLSTLVRLADGEGFLGHSGLWGDRGVDDKIMFTMIGALVQVHPNVYKILSQLGPKIYFATPEYSEPTIDDLISDFHGDEDHELRKSTIKDTVFDYLKWLEVHPSMIDLDHKAGNEEQEEEQQEREQSHVPKMRRMALEWDKASDDRDAIRMIAKLAMLIRKVRANVITYQTKVMTHLKGSDDGKPAPDSSSSSESTTQSTAGYEYEYGHGKPIVERPERPAQILYNLARAHAYEICGRNYITNEDLPILIKIVLSAANRDRIAVIKALLHATKDSSSLIYNELGTTRHIDMSHVVTMEQLSNDTHISRSSIQRAIEELKPLGLIDVYKTSSESHKNAICFKEEFDWLYESGFQDLLKKAFPSRVK